MLSFFAMIYVANFKLRTLVSTRFNLRCEHHGWHARRIVVVLHCWMAPEFRGKIFPFLT
jgi:hypothetical protein